MLCSVRAAVAAPPLRAAAGDWSRADGGSGRSTCIDVRHSTIHVSSSRSKHRSHVGEDFSTHVWHLGGFEDNGLTKLQNCSFVPVRFWSWKRNTAVVVYYTN